MGQSNTTKGKSGGNETKTKDKNRLKAWREKTSQQNRLFEARRLTAGEPIKLEGRNQTNEPEEVEEKKHQRTKRTTQNKR